MSRTDRCFLACNAISSQSVNQFTPIRQQAKTPVAGWFVTGTARRRYKAGDFTAPSFPLFGRERLFPSRLGRPVAPCSQANGGDTPIGCRTCLSPAGQLPSFARQRWRRRRCHAPVHPHATVLNRSLVGDRPASKHLSNFTPDGALFRDRVYGIHMRLFLTQLSLGGRNGPSPDISHYSVHRGGESEKVLVLQGFLTDSWSAPIMEALRRDQNALRERMAALFSDETNGKRRS